MVGVIAVSILFNVPRYLDDHVVTRSDGSMTVVPALLGNYAAFQFVYAGVVYCIIMHVLPLLILSVMTTAT